MIETAPREAPTWHALPPEQALRSLDTAAREGLSTAESRRRLVRFGPNALPEVPARGALAVFAAQFTSPLVFLLLVAAAVAVALGHVGDAIVIAIVVVANAVIGTVQEGRAERSLAALRSIATRRARVLRDGVERDVEAREVVPGDIVLVEAGDAIVADGRIVASAAIQVSEAALTGESVPVGKGPDAVAADTALADRHDMLYAGTLVTAGRARLAVVATGTATEIGRIAALAERAEQPRTQLEQRIARFGRMLVIAALILFALVVVVGLGYGMPFGEILMVAISQLVGMIPEGLPVAMTIALAVGVQRMARRRAIVRKLAAVESLGSTTVICSDKTGTLTRNEMTVVEIAAPDERALLEAAVLCNDAELRRDGDGWIRLGDPTEIALLVAAAERGLDPAELRARHPRIAEVPFEPRTRMMATEHAGFVVIKGAPEVVLALCDADELDEYRARAMAMAANALRVLAFAIVDGGTLVRGEVTGRARWLGLVGEIDPPRHEVREAVARCRAAGIRPVMITGDHVVTALAIARQLDIARDGDEALEGRDLDRLSAAELAERLPRIAVFARVRPEQKLAIVELFQRRGEVVAMTGDGVNDTPALARADVGIAMGATGTEVAKEAADIVLADDNFSTIVAAVEEGRVVYRNLQKALLLLFSTSAAEVAILLLAMLAGYPPPLAAVQILWNNLVSEGLITVNLVLEPAEGDEMQRAPIARREPLIDRTLLRRLLVLTPTITVVTLGWFIVRTNAGIPTAQVQTETFTLLGICEWFNVLNCRSAERSALTWRIFANPWLVGGLVLGNLLQIAVVFWRPLGDIFHTVPFGIAEVVWLGICGSAVLWVEEIRKLAKRRARGGASPLGA